MIKTFKKEIYVNGVLEKTSYVVREVLGDSEEVKWNLELDLLEAMEVQEGLDKLLVK